MKGLAKFSVHVPVSVPAYVQVCSCVSLFVKKSLHQPEYSSGTSCLPQFFKQNLQAALSQQLYSKFNKSCIIEELPFVREDTSQ